MKRNYSSITCQHPNVVLTCTAMSSSQAWNPGAVVANLWEGPSPQATGTLSSGYIAYTAGIYTVHVVDLKSGCTNTDTMQIKDLRAYPQVTTPLQPYELCQSTATLQPVNSSTVPLSFTWTAAPGATVSNLISQQLIVNSAGIYSLLVTDPTNTCSVKLQFTVTICTGMEEFRNPARVSVYPNPAGDHIIIETNTRQNSVITDAMGRNIGELNIEAGRNRLDLSTYPPGIYFISVKKENELIKTVKVIKEN